MCFNVSDRDYWNHRFSTNWVEFKGKEQTRAFMELIVENLPKTIKLNGLSILDWGCALGQGVEVLIKRYPKSEVCGLDVSDVAINYCLDKFPHIDFYCGSLDDLHVSFDVIISSNSLAHFNDPYRWIEMIMRHSNKYVIILVPFNETNIGSSSENKFSFVKGNFPDQLNGFKRIYRNILKQSSEFWIGDQMLVVYEKI